jgi:hypothetical protein
MGDHGELKKSEESSDEETEESSMDHTVFGNLVLFREFLVGSDSFTTLRAQIRSFVLPKSERQDIVQVAVNQIESSESETIATPGYDAVETDGSTRLSAFYRTSLRSAIDIIDTVLVAMGYKELRLKPGFTRLRWRCVSTSRDSTIPLQM